MMSQNIPNLKTSLAWCRFKMILLTVLWAMATGVPAATAQQTYTYININNPYISKIPFAITEFKSMNGLETERDSALIANEIMGRALDFTGYIQIMNPAAFLVNPAQTGITLRDINFRDWTGIGAEFIITGGVTARNGDVKLELRMFDAFKGKLVVGKVYSGPKLQIRKMVHKFCSEVSFFLTGKWGVFDSQIAFVSTVKNNKEVFVCDFDGSNPRQITDHKSITLSPTWSSDRKWLAYSSYARGKPDIYIKNIEENRGAIVNFKGMNISPDWMPNQFKLAAALSFSGDQEIYLLTGKGEIIKRVTKSWGIDVSPCFSPDGNKLAFVSKRAGVPQIYIKDLRTDRVSRLTFEGKYNTSPAWSPDGDRVAYVGVVDNEIDIYSIDLEGGAPIKLTSGQGDNEDPAWSADGSMIVFSSTRQGGRSRLFVMTAGGAYQRQILDLPGKQTDPDWSVGIRKK